MKILYFDVETTGTNPAIHEIIQFAGIIEIDGKIIEEVNYRCQPEKWGNISDDALAVTKITREELQGFEKPGAIFYKIRAFFENHVNKYDKADRLYPAGHNVNFDLNFLQQFWKKYGDHWGTGSYQNWRALDSRVFANFMIYAGKLPVDNVKLQTLCEHFDIEIKAHDALSDIRATRLLIHKMLKMIKK